MSGGMLKKAQERFCGSVEDDEESSKNHKQQRQILQGIFADERDVQELFADPDQTHYYIKVDVETLEELSELACYEEDGIDGRRAKAFAQENAEIVDIFVEVIDIRKASDQDREETVEVSLDYVGVTGDAITNEVIRGACNRFARSLAMHTFDPLAEDHDEPQIVIRPW